MTISTHFQRALRACWLWGVVGVAAAQPVQPTAQSVYDLIFAGRAPEAVLTATELVKAHGSDVWVWVALANAHFAANDLAQAMATLDAADKQLGSRPELQQVRAQLEAAKPTAAAPPKTKAEKAPPRAPTPPAKAPSVWEEADVGFKAFDRGDHALAAEKAYLAVAGAPKEEAYRDLLIHSLVALKEYQKARVAIDEALKAFGPRDVWLANRSLVMENLAGKMTERAHAAIIANDIDLAITTAKSALELSPNVNETRNLLIILLLQTDRLDEAAEQTDLALANDPQDLRALVLRAHLRHRMNRYDAAKADFEAALVHPFLDNLQQRWLRLIYADSAMLEGDWALAESLLKDDAVFATSDPEFATALAARRKRLQEAANRPVDRKKSGAPVARPVLPSQQCRLTPYGNVCIYVPGAPGIDRGYAKATESYAAMANGRYAEAAELAEQAVTLSPDNTQYRQLWLDSLMAAGRTQAAYDLTSLWLADDPTQVDLLLKRSRLAQALGLGEQSRQDLNAALDKSTLGPEAALLAKADGGMKAQAREDLRTGLAQGTFATVAPVRLAYLALKVGDDGLALEQFQAEANARPLTASANADAAFTALRLKMDTVGVAFLKLSMDARRAEALGAGDASQAQALFELQRSVAEVSRTWGAATSLTVGQQSLPAGTGLSTVALSQRSVVLGGEVFWRPWGYRNGGAVEPFVRGYAVLDNTLGGPTGIGHGVFSVGLRAKPFTQWPITFTTWQQLPTRNAIRSDWAVQASYFAAQGTDLRQDVSAWWTWQLALDVGRYARQKLTFGAADLKFGRSFANVSPTGGWVWLPFLGMRADHYSTLATSTSHSADIGLSARYWYRGDAYTAPMSYTDIEVRHRVASTGINWPNASTLRITASY